MVLVCVTCSCNRLRVTAVQCVLIFLYEVHLYNRLSSVCKFTVCVLQLQYMMFVYAENITPSFLLVMGVMGLGLLLILTLPQPCADVVGDSRQTAEGAVINLQLASSQVSNMFIALAETC